MEEPRLRDRLGRVITDLRLSLTERCNYSCVYCRAEEREPRRPELALEDYLRITRLFVSLGVEKVRLTGGEPLLRRGLIDLVRELARLRTASSGCLLDLAITTNGHRLDALALPLKQAGLRRVTVSMDAVEPETCARMTRVPGGFARVLAGVRRAVAVGLHPVKVNCVLLRGVNDHQIEPFAEFARREGVEVRFIEFMPLDEGRGWSLEKVVRMEEIVARLNRWRPLVELPPRSAGETARRFTFDDGRGEIGVIAPVTRPFCGECSRVRLTADGGIRACLFSREEHDLYGEMRRGATDDELRAYIRGIVRNKEARHHIGEPGFERPARTMARIGG